MFIKVIMSIPLGGGHIIFAFSGVRRYIWFPVISRKSMYPIFTKIWYRCLLG